MAHKKTLANFRTSVRRNCDETTTNRFSNDDVDGCINVAKDRVWNEVRRSSGDYFLTSLTSTASNPQTILGETYNPASMQITVDGTALTLPHDFASLKSIDVITSGYERVRFRHLDFALPEFKRLREITSNTTPDEFVFDITNERTLNYAPLSSVALDIRLWYVFKVADLSAAGSELQMPAPLDRAVECFATSELLLGDYAAEAAVWEQKGERWIASFLGADYRQNQDPQFVEASFGETY